MRLSSTVILLCLIFLTIRVQADVVDPIGDENLGALILMSPHEPQPGMTQIAPTSLVAIDQNQKERSISPNSETRLPEGPYSVATTNRPFGTSAKIEVTKKTTTTVQLSALHLDIDLEKMLDVQVGPRPELVINGDLMHVSFNTPHPWAEIMKIHGLQNFKFLTFFPGDLNWQVEGFPILGKGSFRLAPGQVASYKIAIPEKRASLALIPEQNAQFEDATNSSVCNKNLFIAERYADGVNHHSMPHPHYNSAGAVVTNESSYKSAHSTNTYAANIIHFYPQKDSKTHLIYDFWLNGQSTAIELLPGENMTLKLKRVDVNDVKVTTENGDVYYASGQYQVTNLTTGELVTVPNYERCYAPAQLQSTFTTKTGIDVLPGHYKVVVDYMTKEGPKTYETTLDLTK